MELLKRLVVEEEGQGLVEYTCRPSRHWFSGLPSGRQT
jgi:hypothetical protein